jgi:hypothetical protein
MIVPILPFYATNFGASAAVVGLLIFLFSIAQLLVARSGAASPIATAGGRPFSPACW